MTTMKLLVCELIWERKFVNSILAEVHVHERKANVNSGIFVKVSSKETATGNAAVHMIFSIQTTKARRRSWESRNTRMEPWGILLPGAFHRCVSLTWAMNVRVINVHIFMFALKWSKDRPVIVPCRITLPILTTRKYSSNMIWYHTNLWGSLLFVAAF